VVRRNEVLRVPDYDGEVLLQKRFGSVNDNFPDKFCGGDEGAHGPLTDDHYFPMLKRESHCAASSE